MQNLSSEKKVLDFWLKAETFKKSLNKNSPKGNFVFYDGPPFATGMPHYGHLLCSTIKDAVNRYQTMRGKRVERIWGWDCHGLPIENIIEKKLNIKNGKREIEQLGIAKFNNACRAEVLRLDKEWEKIITRIGRWVDFKHSYKTMDLNYMESVWWGFSQLNKKGLIYQNKKIILYCPRCVTPLSNFEIAMDDSYQNLTEQSTVYKYKIKNQKNTFFLAWSTTPWNKLATPALAVNPNLTYIKIKQNNEYYYLAKNTVKILEKAPYKIKEQITGKELQNLEFELHYDFFHERKAGERVGAIIADNFVTDEEGTGIVTLAAYGEDDLRVMQLHNIQIIEHVDGEGKLKSEVKPWAKLDILKVNPLVNQDLEERELIYRHIPYTHDVPICYRCGTRLYYAPLPAWFINVQKIKNQLISENEKIRWFPTHLKRGRFLKGLQNAPDWNISRSRYWGTPMPVWVGQDEKGKNIIRIIGSIEELKQWAVNQKQLNEIKDIHREFLDNLEIWVDKNKTVKGKRIPEVFDCWVESGSMPFASKHYPFEQKELFEQNYPADFVSEYIAQTRAWFYTMHVMSVGIFNKPAFRNVLTSGTILAEDGSKMSKSKKNFPDPLIIIDKYGTDTLRYYLLSSPVVLAENLSFSEDDLANISKKNLMTLWNVYKFYELYKNNNLNINSKPLSFNMVWQTSANILDQWILINLNKLIIELTEAMEIYNLPSAMRLITNFINDLSLWYIRRSRKRFKSENKEENTTVLTTTVFVLNQLLKIIAPFCPFIAEEIWQKITEYNFKKDNKSIHLESWPASINFTLLQYSNEQKILKNMQLVRTIVELGLAERHSQQIKVRQPLNALIIKNANNTLTQLSEEYINLIKEEINVKKIKFIKSKRDKLTIKLDTKITPELKKEGFVRELIRAVNSLRKEAGLSINDTAEIYYSDNKTFKSILTHFNSIIIQETLCAGYKTADMKQIELKKEISLDKEKFWIGIKTVKKIVD